MVETIDQSDCCIGGELISLIHFLVGELILIHLPLRLCCCAFASPVAKFLHDLN